MWLNFFQFICIFVNFDAEREDLRRGKDKFDKFVERVMICFCNIDEFWLNLLNLFSDVRCLAVWNRTHRRSTKGRTPVDVTMLAEASTPERILADASIPERVSAVKASPPSTSLCSSGLTHAFAKCGCGDGRRLRFKIRIFDWILHVFEF